MLHKSIIQSGTTQLSDSRQLPVYYKTLQKINMTCLRMELRLIIINALLWMNPKSETSLDFKQFNIITPLHGRRKVHDIFKATICFFNMYYM